MRGWHSLRSCPAFSRRFFNAFGTSIALLARYSAFGTLGIYPSALFAWKAALLAKKWKKREVYVFKSRSRQSAPLKKPPFPRAPCTHSIRLAGATGHSGLRTSRFFCFFAG